MTEIALDTAIAGTVPVPPSPRIAEIIDHERQADQLAAAADAHRWEAARLIATELASGKTQRQLAAQIGKSQAHVSFMARAWRDYHGNQDRPAFTEVYQALKAAPAPSAIGAPVESPEARGIPERALRELAAARALQDDAAGEMLRTADGTPVTYEQAVEISRRIAGSLAALERSITACLAYGMSRLQVAALAEQWTPDPPLESDLVAAVMAWPAGPLAELAMADDELRAAYLARSGEAR